jgi:G3E family GTPase
MLDSNIEKIPSIIQVDSYGKIKKKKQILNKIENKNMVKTISLETTNALDFDKFNTWIFEFLRLKGEKIYRMKGNLKYF